MVKVYYRERKFIDRYHCIDTVKSVALVRHWYYGGLLYGYLNRFETITIGKEDIIRIEEVE